jgi:ATP-dependent Lhr-like helicase
LPGFFSAPTAEWFGSNFAAPTPAQNLGWPLIAQGLHTLIAAPTGSGKTLAAFLWALDRLGGSTAADGPPGARVVYVSPLKALVYDIERNLRAPLAGVRRAAERLGSGARELGVDVRTGDTPPTERRRQAREPGRILVTTPESLFLILGSRAAENLRGVHTLIVDEVHALAPVKRGVHLALSLERLAAIADADPQRIGLSATVNPLAEAACFLGGDRDVAIVDALAPPRLDLRVVVPVPDMERVVPPDPRREGGPLLGRMASDEAPAERGIWAVLYPALLREIRANRSTLVFVNSRGLCERLCRRLNELAGEELVQAHHGSVSNERRAQIEDGLKRGNLRGIVATSSLELGIDMGAVDRVLQVESPGSVARGLQRVGRAGHAVGEISVGRIYPKFRGDLLECAVVADRMRRGEIEELRVPANALDVLAQHLVALCCAAPRSPRDLEALVRRAHPYRELSTQALEGVLDMLSGHYPGGELAELRPLLVWDRSRDQLSARRGAPVLSRLNAGTIPDRGSYPVYLGAGGPRLGELDEEMVFETRAGDNILLGATTWRVEEIGRDRVMVSPAPGEPGRMPFWRGEGPGRPVSLGRELGGLVRRLDALGAAAARRWLEDQAGLDGHAAANLVAYLTDQRAHTGTLPTDRAITVERFRDELGDWRLCILSPFGARVHGPWAMALQRLIGSDAGFEVQVMYTDDGIVVRLADTEEAPDPDRLFPDPDALDDLVTEQLGTSSLFAGLFRENAARALLMPRRSARGRQPLWAQRLKAQQLLAAVRRYPGFPIVIETYRECLADVFDMRALRGLLRDVQDGRIRVDEVETRSASPFARSLVFAYVAAYIYEQDAPLAERKAQALTLDRNLLAELLGQEELRDLIDGDALDALEDELQHRTADRRARDADELHDLLRRLGDLAEPEITRRCTAAPRPWLAALEASRRAMRVRIAGEPRWIAAEDAALYRDALGCVPPPGLPEALLVPVDEPLESLLRRFARTRGPFPAASVAERLGLRLAQLGPAFRLLEAQGTLVQGAMRPGGSGVEWCDAEVLRRLRRRTLARLRRAVTPVDGAALGRFLPAWQSVEPGGAGVPARGAHAPRGLLEVIEPLEGLAIPWSALAEAILPARSPGARAQDLDMLAASGELVWVGAGALGVRDGRVALYRRARARDLLEMPEAPGDLDPAQSAVLEHLGRRGACFVTELEQAVAASGVRVGRTDLEAALWRLVWAGLITNDTFAPLRALSGGAARRSGVLGGGRWSLVADLADAACDGDRRAVARAEMLLGRYGVVSREMVQAEGLPGGFGPLYRVLARMEEAGRVRRGYFVEGLAGAQFARPGAVERLRASRVEEPPLDGFGPDDALALRAVDPANPYGAVLPWPQTGDPAFRPRRVPRAWVVLVAGTPVLYLAPRGRRLASFRSHASGPDALTAAAGALVRLKRYGRRRSLLIERVDGVPALDSGLKDVLVAAGFEPDYNGLVLPATLA